MRRKLLFSTGLLIVTAAGLPGCGVAPTALAPTPAPVTVQTEVAMDAEPTTTPAARTAPSPPPDEARPTVSPASVPSQVTPPAEAEQALRLAREDLSQRLGLAVEAIQLVSAEAVEWSDASLGCPQPGMLYAQVITPGYRVTLQAGGEEYTYHTDTGRRVVYCQPAQSQPSPGTEATDTVSLARSDLAQRLNIAVDDVAVLSVIGQEFTSDGFYCRASKERTARDETPPTLQGETILLDVAGRRYEYHASGQMIVFCRELR